MKRCPKCGKSFPDEANFCPTDAGRLVAVSQSVSARSAAVAAPDLVGDRFMLGAAVGGSATGAVHRGTDLDNGQVVALKLVAPAVIALPQVAQRIERELKHLERVQHAAVARVIGSGKHGDSVFVAMEFVDGVRPLGELVAARGPVKLPRAVQIVLAIGEALIEAAKVGVVHRDLAPENILVGGEVFKLVNFAIPTPGNRVPGVPEFIAPETIEGKPIDQRSSIYSLGAVFYFMVTGRAPHIGDAQSVLAAHQSAEIAPPSSLVAIPREVDAVVLRALDRNPARRYLTLRQFLDEVERVGRDPEADGGHTVPLTKSTGKGKELNQTLMGFGGSSPEAHPSQVAEVRPEPAAPAPVVAPAPVIVAPEPAFAPAPAPAPAAAPAIAHAPHMDLAPVEVMPPVVVSEPAPKPAEPAPKPAEPAPKPAEPAPPVAASRGGGHSGPAGKKRAPDERKGNKGKFRETLWFKKGALDAQAAEEAANDPEATGKADLVPIEDRYLDDGSVSSRDASEFSLKTGRTSSMPAISGGDDGAGNDVSERELVGEMKQGRRKVIGALVAGAVAVTVLILLLL